MKQPLFSFVVAVYNTADYLPMCLNSLVSQSIPAVQYEIILVNDCSTDSSLEVIKHYMDNYHNIKLINKAQNEGTFWARIDGFSAASGQYFVIVDPDDWVSPCMLERLSHIIKYTPADIIEIGHIAENGTDSIPSHEIHSGYQNIQFLVERFTMRTTISALWQRIYSQKIIHQSLQIIRNHFCHNAYNGLCVEDEFIFPILLNSADSYYITTDCLYHYRTFRLGSSMANVAADCKKKLLHAALTVQAAGKIFDIYNFSNANSAYYFYMQTNNLFYYMGQILEQKAWNELPILKSAILAHSNNFCKYHKNILSGKPSFQFQQLSRYLHLLFKAKILPPK